MKEQKFRAWFSSTKEMVYIVRVFKGYEPEMVAKE
jgi:hypothetical protein